MKWILSHGILTDQVGVGKVMKSYFIWPNIAMFRCFLFTIELEL